MNDLDLPVSTQTVFQRTERGQVEVLARRLPLSPIERRLLQMMTGHTQLGDLLALLGEAAVPVPAVHHLLNKHLICAVEMSSSPPSGFRPFEVPVRSASWSMGSHCA